MVKLRSLLLFLMLILLVSACQMNQAESQALPTLAQLPTVTPSDTPTETPDVTATFTPTPTATETFTPSQTFTPSLTTTVTLTRTPRATATNSLTPTPSLTATSENTITPIPTRTPNAPVIELFDASTTTAPPGTQIILRWIVDADAVRLETLNQQGAILDNIPVDLTATYPVTLPTAGTVVIYRLVAVRSNDEVRSVVTIQLGQQCQINWFFSNPITTTGCPTSPPAQLAVTFQRFQSGYMFRVLYSGQERICGMQTGLKLYACYGFQVYNDPPPATPPAGFLPPDSDFEYVYYNTLATGGFWYNVIGWATATSSVSAAQSQLGDDGLLYIQLPIGVYAFDSALSGKNVPLKQITQP